MPSLWLIWTWSSFSADAVEVIDGTPSARATVHRVIDDFAAWTGAARFGVREVVLHERDSGRFGLGPARRVHLYQGDRGLDGSARFAFCSAYARDLGVDASELSELASLCALGPTTLAALRGVADVDTRAQATGVLLGVYGAVPPLPVVGVSRAELGAWRGPAGVEFVRPLDVSWTADGALVVALDVHGQRSAAVLDPFSGRMLGEGTGTYRDSPAWSAEVDVSWSSVRGDAWPNGDAVVQFQVDLPDGRTARPVLVRRDGAWALPAETELAEGVISRRGAEIWHVWLDGSRVRWARLSRPSTR